jgi:predicted metal-dependent hydrolase
MLEAILNKSRTRTIKPRPLSVRLDHNTPRYWMAGDPFETHLLNALSLIFPPGERYFMRSVRNFRDAIEDPALAEQVRAFLAQESLHSREHSALNHWLEGQGIAARVIESHIENRIAERSKRRGPLNDLAVTCALEHLTAVIAKLFLTSPDLQERFHESVRPLWVWHAIEELDHKAVAFDVYLAAGGEHRRRVLAMLVATIGLLGSSMILQRSLMVNDGQQRNWGSYARGLLRYFGPKGYVLRVVPDYLRYFRRDFHPWEEDSDALIQRAERELVGMLAALAA